MTWSYETTILADSEKDQIRLEIGDTTARDDGLTLADEEIAQAITVEQNFWTAAARCAELLSRRFLLKADVKLGRDLQLAYTKTAAQYAEMAKELRAKSLATVLPWVGGRSIAEKIAAAADTSAVQPAFTKGMLRNPRAGGSTADTVLDDDDIEVL